MTVLVAPSRRLFRCSIDRLADRVGCVPEAELTEHDECDGAGCPECNGLGRVIGYGIGGDNYAPIPAVEV